MCTVQLRIRKKSHCLCNQSLIGRWAYGMFKLPPRPPPQPPRPPRAQAIPPSNTESYLDSRRMVYPTVSPGLSPRSVATRSATDTAEIRRGCVHSTRQALPCCHDSSRIYCGTWVVLPQPVSPLMSTTCSLLMLSSICCLRFSHMHIRV